MFLSTHKTSLTAALAVLTIALPFGCAAFAQSPTTIADGERSAQSVIVDPPSHTRSRAVASGTTDAVTLADNEHAAQRAIVDSPAPGAVVNGSRHPTFGSATLARSERAAQEAIVGSVLSPRDASAYRSAHVTGTATQAADETSARGN
ncbi:MAG: hypothetical protein ABI843_01645 [Dokdonella sp.]